MDASTVLPLIWAQATTSAASSTSGSSGGAPASILVLAFRRWSGSLTLSAPDPAIGPISAALWAWLAGLGLLFVFAAIVQGPGRAIGQLFDLRGHFRLLGSAIDRVRRSGRLLGLVVGISVLTWTGTQTYLFNVAAGRDDVLLLIKGHRRVDVALDQGFLAALTPLRDVVGLGQMIPLLIGAAVVLFQFSTDRWGTGIRAPISIRRRSSRWATIGWGVVALQALYRFVCLVTNNPELPLGGCLIPEVAIVPALTALSDGVLVAWVVVELRNSGLGDVERDSLDVVSVTLLVPASALACLMMFPGRYLGSGAWLMLQNYVPAAYASEPWVIAYFRWQLGWGLVQVQAAGVAFAGLLGAVAWSRGTAGSMLRGYVRLVSAGGGHLVGSVALAGLGAGALSAASYLLVLSLPTSTWILGAADSYAHYATLAVGLVLAAATIELGERSLPEASLAEIDAPAS